MTKQKPPVSDIEKFRARVDDSAGPDGCHPWTGALSTNHGYGRFYVNGSLAYAHRWILGYQRGSPLGRSEHGLHSCDNPPCVNLGHLRVGTHLDNMQDMFTKGRRTAWNSLKTHCPAGHPYSGDNLYVLPSSGARSCRTCTNEKRALARRLLGIRQKNSPDCPHGHLLTPENTRMKGATRVCRECERKYRERKRIERAA